MMSENTLFNLAIKFCQSGNPVPKQTIMEVLAMSKDKQAEFLGYVASWCVGAQATILEERKEHEKE